MPAAIPPGSPPRKHWSFANYSVVISTIWLWLPVQMSENYDKNIGNWFPVLCNLRETQEWCVMGYEIRTTSVERKLSRRKTQVHGWIESQEKVKVLSSGQRRTYRYWYYRWESWKDGRLLKTHSYRLTRSQAAQVQGWIKHEKLSVDKILGRLKISTD